MFVADFLLAVAGVALLLAFLVPWQAEQAELPRVERTAALLSDLHAAAKAYLRTHYPAIEACLDMPYHVARWQGTTGSASGGEATPWLVVPLYTGRWRGVTHHVSTGAPLATCRAPDIAGRTDDDNLPSMASTGLLPASLSRLRYPAHTDLGTFSLHYWGPDRLHLVFLVRGVNANPNSGIPRPGVQALVVAGSAPNYYLPQSFAEAVAARIPSADVGLLASHSLVRKNDHLPSFRGLDGSWQLNPCYIEGGTSTTTEQRFTRSSTGAPHLAIPDDYFGGTATLRFIRCGGAHAPARSSAHQLGLIVSHSRFRPLAAAGAVPALGRRSAVHLPPMIGAAAGADSLLASGTGLRHPAGLVAADAPAARVGFFFQLARDDALAEVLHRRDIGIPDANRMETQLDMGGYGLLNTAYLGGPDLDGDGRPDRGVHLVGPQPPAVAAPGATAADPDFPTVIHGNLLVTGSAQVGGDTIDSAALSRDHRGRLFVANDLFVGAGHQAGNDLTSPRVGFGTAPGDAPASRRGSAAVRYALQVGGTTDAFAAGGAHDLSGAPARPAGQDAPAPAGYDGHLYVHRAMKVGEDSSGTALAAAAALHQAGLLDAGLVVARYGLRAYAGTASSPASLAPEGHLLSADAAPASAADLYGAVPARPGSTARPYLRLARADTAVQLGHNAHVAQELSAGDLVARGAFVSLGQAVFTRNVRFDDIVEFDGAITVNAPAHFNGRLFVNDISRFSRTANFRDDVDILRGTGELRVNARRVMVAAHPDPSVSAPRTTLAALVFQDRPVDLSTSYSDLQNQVVGRAIAPSANYGGISPGATGGCPDGASSEVIHLPYAAVHSGGGADNRVVRLSFLTGLNTQAWPAHLLSPTATPPPELVASWDQTTAALRLYRASDGYGVNFATGRSLGRIPRTGGAAAPYVADDVRTIQIRYCRFSDLLAPAAPPPPP